MSKETRLISVGTLLLLSFLACRRNSDQHHSSGILGELEEAYRTKITVSKLGLSKGENFLGDTVFYVKGIITNSGEEKIQRVVLTFLFKDSTNQVVLKDTRKAIEYRGGRGIESLQAAEFQVAFENLPQAWNYIVPEVQVSQIGLQ